MRRRRTTPDVSTPAHFCARIILTPFVRCLLVSTVDNLQGTLLRLFGHGVAASHSLEAFGRSERSEGCTGVLDPNADNVAPASF